MSCKEASANRFMDNMLCGIAIFKAVPTYSVSRSDLTYFGSLDFQQELSFGLKMGHVYVH